MTDFEDPPSGRDPRLEIPEVLRTPVRRPSDIGEAAGTRRPVAEGDERTTADMAKGWAIALTFVYSLIGAGLIGWAIQKWLVPSWAPWPLLVGLLVGLIGGFARFIREAMLANSGGSSRRSPPTRGRQ